MFKINKMTQYSVSILSSLEEGAVLSVPDIAIKTLIPVPTVAKISKTLQKKGFMISSRGAGGGYTLSRPLAKISVAEIIEALEGPIKIASCIESGNHCSLSGSCSRRLNWLKVNQVLTDALNQLSLAEMSGSRRCSDD